MSSATKDPIRAELRSATRPVSEKMMKLCFVVSSPITARAFLRGHMIGLGERHRIFLAANAEPPAVSWAVKAGIQVLTVPIERRISPLSDLRALADLVLMFRKHRFDIVHSATPKAGLLAMAAAWLARVPVRIHTFTGQVWATRKGPMRWVLRAMDRLIARCATHVLVDSTSQREFLLANRVVSATNSMVLANGSICGVDGARFWPDAAARARTRGESRIPEDAVVFLYLGRLSRDKGVLDLALAFARLARRHASAFLAYVGPDEGLMRERIEGIAAPCADRVRWVDWTERPEEWMAAAEVFCLPSYREGFGQVAVEAAACGLPVVASRIYGIVDAVVDGQTGLLHPPADIEALQRHMETLLLNADLRRALGDAGRARVLRDFSAERVTRALLDYYAEVTRKL